MSQIRFTSGLKQVLTGWDRPMGQHFLVVSVGDQDLYNNLDDLALPRMGAMTSDQVIAKLRELEVAVPRQLARLLDEHQRENVGNRILDFGSNYPAAKE